MSKQNHFIGFGTFEELLASSPNKSLYLMQSVETRPGQFPGLQTADWFVTAASVEDGKCHYWRQKFGNYQLMNGAPVPVNKNIPADCENRCLRAIEALSGIARDYDFRIIRALVSFPTDLLVLHGTTRLLRYIPETNTFERVIPEAEKLAA